MKKEYVVISVSAEDMEDESAEIAKLVERYGLVEEVMKSWVECLRDAIGGIDEDLYFDTLYDAAKYVMKREGHDLAYALAVNEEDE